jgi:hypothetical protein
MATHAIGDNDETQSFVDGERIFVMVADHTDVALANHANAHVSSPRRYDATMPHPPSHAQES